MSAFTMFTICIYAGVVLVQFLFPRSNEVPTTRKRLVARIDQIRQRNRVRASGHAITPVYSRLRLFLRPSSVSSGALFLR